MPRLNSCSLVSLIKIKVHAAVQPVTHCSVALTGRKSSLSLWNLSEGTDFVRGKSGLPKCESEKYVQQKSAQIKQQTLKNYIWRECEWVELQDAFLPHKYDVS